MPGKMDHSYMNGDEADVRETLSNTRSTKPKAIAIMLQSDPFRVSLVNKL